MKIRYFQKGFNYSQDGPGNRLVIHMQGCNLHCPWCSNPEGMKLDGGVEEDVKDLANFIISCKRIFLDGGGVTFTGGECTVQAEALKEVLTICKENNIHTAIETNGTFSLPHDFYPLIDLIICDFKHFNDKKLKEIIGCVYDYKKNIIEYLKYGKDVLIRTVLINGFNTDDGDAEKFANFFDDKPTDNARFEFLLYHEYGKEKWKKLGLTYKVDNGFVSNKTREQFEEIYRKHGLKIIRS